MEVIHTCNLDVYKPRLRPMHRFTLGDNNSIVKGITGEMAPSGIHSHQLETFIIDSDGYIQMTFTDSQSGDVGCVTGINNVTLWIPDIGFIRLNSNIDKTFYSTINMAMATKLITLGMFKAMVTFDGAKPDIGGLVGRDFQLTGRYMEGEPAFSSTPIITGEV